MRTDKRDFRKEFRDTIMSNARNIHFEAVGSYLRPAELKEARAKFADGKISATDLRSIEDRLITEVVKQQKAHHLPYITDGEFRRSYWPTLTIWPFRVVSFFHFSC